MAAQKGVCLFSGEGCWTTGIYSLKLKTAWLWSFQSEISLSRCVLHTNTDNVWNNMTNTCGTQNDLTQLSITEQLWPSVSMCLLPITTPLPAEISNNARLECYKWVEHSCVWHKIHWSRVEGRGWRAANGLGCHTWEIHWEKTL